MTASAEQWEQGYDRCLEIATRYRARFTADGGYDDERRGNIAKYLRGYPVHQFGFVRDRIRDLPRRTETTDEAYIARLIFFLVQDCRNAYLACSCPRLRRHAGGAAGAGVAGPHGRRRVPDPARRPLPPLPAAAEPRMLAGRARVGERRPGDLAPMGAGVHDARGPGRPGRRDRDRRDSQTVAGVVETLTCPPFVRCGDRVVVQVAVYEGERRVIGFCGAPVDNPRTMAEEVSPELERVPGIGPEYARTLHTAGFTTLAALGRASVQDVSTALQGDRHTSEQPGELGSGQPASRLAHECRVGAGPGPLAGAPAGPAPRGSDRGAGGPPATAAPARPRVASLGCRDRTPAVRRGGSLPRRTRSRRRRLWPQPVLPAPIAIPVEIVNGWTSRAGTRERSTCGCCTPARPSHPRSWCATPAVTAGTAGGATRRGRG